MTIEQLYEIYLRHPSIKTDTRQLEKGELFFALKGPSFNGNTFAYRALELGAAYVVIDEDPQARTTYPPGPGESDRLILVPDVLQTLQQLALHHRRQFDIPFIAITGSNGKTTTKELIHAVLSSTFNTYSTVGNLNNHIGIPLTLLSIRNDAQIAVIEMGANHQKEIEGYCRYTLPTHGIITNVGKAHLEGFGGPEGVKKGKGELYDFLRSPDTASIGGGTAGGTAFVFRDSDDLVRMSRGIPHIVTYGTHDADFTGVMPGITGRWTSYPPDSPKPPPSALPPAGTEVASTRVPDAFFAVRITHGAEIPLIGTQLVGDYNLPNVLAAVAVGKHFGVADLAIRDSIERYNPTNSRSQLIEQDGNHIDRKSVV
jgi:UDP-N-acetylmuramoyl-tripeptide--D-alanyl-D-alanine ligase